MAMNMKYISNSKLTYDKKINVWKIKFISALNKMNLCETNKPKKKI